MTQLKHIDGISLPYAASEGAGLSFITFIFFDLALNIIFLFHKIKHQHGRDLQGGKMAASSDVIAEEEVFYAQVESYLERKEYQRKGRCVRFSAVNAKDRASEEGLITWTIDLSYWRFCDLIEGGWITESVQKKINKRDKSWYELKVTWEGEKADGYAYPTFSTASPRYFSLLSCTPVVASTSPTKPLLGTSDPVADITALGFATTTASDTDFGTGAAWTLWTFHVGQGMCSLLSDGKEHGILLDAGAGTPVKRPDYLKKCPAMVNQLRDKLKGLKQVDMVLSHADRDHWSLVAWDSVLRDQIRTIYIPHNAKEFTLALKDKAVKSKVTELSNEFTYQLSGGGTLRILRSDPKSKDDNSNCLVAVYECGKKEHLVLQSGDYVYKDMGQDTMTAIRQLKDGRYTAIIVPHHGDEASAKNVFPPHTADKSIAFFSAGDNDQYGHPTDASKAAHEAAHFKIISDKNCLSIMAVQLAP